MKRACYVLGLLLLVRAQNEEDLDVNLVVSVLPQVDLQASLPQQAQAMGVPLKAILVSQENSSMEVTQDAQLLLCSSLFEPAMCSAAYCPLGHYCLQDLPPAPCPNNTYGPIEGLSTCLPCPTPLLSPPGSTNVTECTAEGLEMQWVPLRAPPSQPGPLWPALSAFYGVDQSALTLG